MKPEAQRIAIAEACGFLPPYESGTDWEEPIDDIAREVPTLRDGGNQLIPEYLTDLNAMHEAEKALPQNNRTQDVWFEWLKTVCSQTCTGSCTFAATHATAAQRAEAFLRTLNKWTEE